MRLMLRRPAHGQPGWGRRFRQRLEAAGGLKAATDPANSESTGVTILPSDPQCLRICNPTRARLHDNIYICRE